MNNKYQLTLEEIVNIEKDIERFCNMLLYQNSIYLKSPPPGELEVRINLPLFFNDDETRKKLLEIFELSEFSCIEMLPEIFHDLVRKIKEDKIENDKKVEFDITRSRCTISADFI